MNVEFLIANPSVYLFTITEFVYLNFILRW